MQQNDVPFLLTLSVQNVSSVELKELTVLVETSPVITALRAINVASLPPGRVMAVPPDQLRVQLLRDRLVNQEEREKAELWVEVKDDLGATLARRRFEFELLAYNEWNGVSALPEILAAFVMPNHPVLETVIPRASALLRERTGDAQISGYQNRDAARVLLEIWAIYDALSALGISYVNPPASFETTGQKIRTPDQVTGSRLGTCVDLAVLFAACLEHAGFAPLLALKQGHAFAGAWLRDASFEAAVVPAALAVKKRVDLGEIVMVETTGLAMSPPVPFADACRHAAEHFDAPAEFHYALDVRMARRMGIRPMAARLPTEGARALEFGQAPAGPTAPEGTLPDAAVAGWTGEAEAAASAAAENAQVSRLDRWKRRLLDLTRRNPLLNFRDTKKNVPILCPDLGALEDALASDVEFAVLPPTATMSHNDPRDPGIHRDRTGEDALESFLRAQMAARRLHSSLPEAELERRMLEVSRADRLSMEESGASTLFLALGFLRWYAPDDTATPNLAPIILVPMQIERRSVREGFRVRMLDEEARINVTLLEKLKADFGIDIPGLDPLPVDDAGLHMDRILQQILAAIKDYDRWDVDRSASLAILTFTKFVMWHDLQEHASLLKGNPIVRHLLETPGQAFAPQVAMADPAQLDRELPPAQSYCPLDADSSQLAAIVAAERGVSFVIQGPPGTGKSQTIANLVAHCMTKGKRVLFVSEKMAALEVVKKRLDAVGLGPFCLELHSRKANKQDFRRQLDEALELDQRLQPEDWSRQTALLQQRRADLNAYVEALHAPRPCGQSAWWAINRMIEFKDIRDVEADFGAMADMTPEKADALLDTARQLETGARTAGLAPAHPLRDLRLDTWEIGIENRAADALAALTAAAAEFGAQAASALQPLRLGSGRWSRFVLETGGELAACLLDVPPLGAALVHVPDWSSSEPRLRETIAIGRTCEGLRRQLMAAHTEAFLQLPIPELSRRLHASRESNALVAWWVGWQVRRAVRAVQRQPAPLSLADIGGHFQLALQLQAEESRLAQNADLVALFAAHWRAGHADWALLERQLDWVTRFKAVVARFPFKDPAEGLEALDLWIGLATDKRDVVTADGPLGKAFVRCRAAQAAFATAWSRVQALLRLDVAAAVCDPHAPDHLDALAQAAGRWRSGLAELRSWCAYQEARKAAVAAGFAPVVTVLEEGKAAVADCSCLCEKTFVRWCLKQVLAGESALGRFFGSEHSRKIAEFRRLDEAVRDLTRLAVFAELTMRLPRQNVDLERVKSSEMGTLKRYAKGGRFTIRQAFGECPNALARLKPCVLMSPLSVAQFLGVDFPAFDIVVFDEASQMPPWEAVGAIARGRQVVVVGDSRQLPPTSFFERTAGAETQPSEDDFEDLESILDECVACQLPAHSLTWHYRSRHESLIAFSNCNYYSNRLLTFPSACSDTQRLGVSLREVTGGFYDASRSRTNRAEAEAVVADLVARLADPAQRTLSIGVVTFSIAQQGLIEDLIERARHDHPEIDPYFTDSVPEPVFVKNLETVQGDERDVILFSICYGPNRDGKVYMNFGPLSNKGGERRLNVAITRSRRQLVVFSTLRPEHMDLARSAAVGVQQLKAFLAFAAKGVAALGALPAPAGKSGRGVPFENAVAAALATRGWRVDTQVGCSGYRIDLAVQHPGFPGSYLLGIECDGAAYHSAKTARDRDRLRQAVLGSLGWKLTRVWSTDWWLHSEKEAERLHADLQRAMQEFKPPGARAGTPGGNIVTTQAAAEEPPPAAPSPSSALPPVPVADENGDGVPDLPGQQLYQCAELPRVSNDPDDFFAPRARRQIAGMVAKVLATEAPVHPEVLARRVAGCWGIARLTAVISDRVRDLLPAELVRIEKTATREFIWRSDQDPATYEGFRVPNPGDNFLRSAEHIAPQEMANVMHQLLKEHLSLQSDDLIRVASQVFGIARVGTRVRAAFQEGLDCHTNRQKPA